MLKLNIMEGFNSPKPVDDCYHVYSNGTKMVDMFSERKDKILMMNMLAVTSYSNKVHILVDQVMDTHFHAIISGTPQGCAKFTRDMIMKLNIFINKKGRNEYANGGIEVSMDPIVEFNELKNKIMYVYRNSIAARFPLMPWEYEWGPGNIYFVNHTMLSGIGRPLSDFSKKQQRKMFHTNVLLPQEWKVNSEGMIMQHSYFDWQRVENIFITPIAFIAFLHQKKDIEVMCDSECNKSKAEEFSEKILRKEANDLCMAVYGKKISQASTEQRLSISTQLWKKRRTYSTSYLSRATLIPKDVLDSIFSKD